MVLISRLGASVASLILAVVLARALGPAGRGEFALAFLLPTVLILLVEAGLESTGVYFTARRNECAGRLLGSLLLVCIMAGTIGVVAGWLTVALYGGVLFPDVSRHVLLVSVWVIPGRLLAGLMRGLFLGGGYTREYCWLEFLQTPLWLLGVFILLCSVGLRVSGVMWASVFSFAAVGVTGLIWSLRIGPGAEKIRVHWGTIRDTLSFGLRLQPASVISFLNYRLDILLLGHLSDQASVGLYVVAVALAEKIWLLSRSVSTALFSSLSGDLHPGVRREMTAKTARISLVFLALVGIAIAVVAGPVINILFGIEFTVASDALRALLPGVVMLGLAQVFGVDVTARGRPGLNSWTGFVGLLVNVSLNYWWIPRYGIVGAAWASSVSYGVIFLQRLGLYIYFSKTGVWWLFWLRGSDIREAKILLEGEYDNLKNFAARLFKQQ